MKRRTTTRTGAIAVLFFAAAILFPISAVGQDISLTGMIRSYTGIRFSRGDTPINEETVDLTLEGWGGMSHAAVNAYAKVGTEHELQLGVREAYIDLYFSILDLRVGKQAVVWGAAEGAFITDIVSPRDLRSFILADFREIRMGIPAVKGDLYLGPFTLEAVWVPWFEPAALPEADSMWRTSSMPSMDNAAMPGDDLKNSEIFGKLSYFGSILNAEIMAGYAWDDMPVMTGFATMAPSLHFERNVVVGGSFSTTFFGSLVLRSEAALYVDRHFTAMTSPGVLETVQKHQLHVLGGLDWSLLGIDMSTQYMLQHIFEYESSLMGDEFAHTLTLRLRKSFLSDVLILQFFGYLGIDPMDALLRPSVIWSIEDGVEAEIGGEIFLGDEGGTFGVHKDNTMVTASLRWYF